MTRLLLIIAIVFMAGAAQAQVPPTFGAYANRQSADSTQLKSKWFLTKNIGLSYSFFTGRGISGSVVSAPMSLQLNRQLNNNLVAFAGVSVAPNMLQFHNAFNQPQLIGAKHGFMNQNNFNLSPSAHMGLMYISNDRTFSVSGSIGVMRNNYYYNSPFSPIGSMGGFGSPVYGSGFNHFR
ncbi:MAG: hypothetical protein P0Y53_16435 [Candidatus Pseudobacter hemicellulosilyticus]|uniref:Uncharacterized protein n=1 Tax=Candidatus Pseudobacter hemicellulosilyticus TaxID=3121375 RepID=A0AAJ5WLF2_9BACT|nr:MAG: hypothetical protein P0Y53_16435 [Pseudobacter sp.]